MHHAADADALAAPPQQRHLARDKPLHRPVEKRHEPGLIEHRTAFHHALIFRDVSLGQRRRMEVAIRSAQQRFFVAHAVDRQIRSVEAYKSALVVLGVEAHPGNVLEEFHQRLKRGESSEELLLKRFQSCFLAWFDLRGSQGAASGPRQRW